MMTPIEYLVFVLHFNERKSLTEIAGMMDLPEENVRQIRDTVEQMTSGPGVFDRSPDLGINDGSADDWEFSHWHRAA